MPTKPAAYNVFLAFYPPLAPQDVRQSDFAILLMPKENGSDRSTGPMYRYLMSKSPSGKLQYERQTLSNSSDAENACRVLLGKLADSCGDIEQATRRLDQVMSTVLNWSWEEAGRTNPPHWVTVVLDKILNKQDFRTYLVDQHCGAVTVAQLWTMSFDFVAQHHVKGGAVPVFSPYLRGAVPKESSLL